MYKIEPIRELNRQYLKVTGDVVFQTDDFRYRMLLSNCIEGIIPMRIRSINGQREICFDVTGRESLENGAGPAVMGRTEVKELFGEIMKVSVGIERFLIDEGSLIMKPDMIYRNMKTGKYEFVCVPDISEEDRRGNDTLVEFMRFIVGKIDTGDEVMTEALYGLYDMAVLGNVSLATMYEILMGELREIKFVPGPQTEIRAVKEEQEMKKKKKHYIPSWKELGALAMCLGGLALVGTNLFSIIVH